MTDLEIRVVENEPRIYDLDVAARLGYARPVKIRELIQRHRSALERLGTVPTVGTVIRGQHATEYFLNRAQALFIVTKAETAEAITATVEIVRKFDVYERGNIVSPATSSMAGAAPAEIAQEAARIVLAHLGMVPDQIGALDGKVDRLLIITNELAMNRRVTIPVNVVKKHLSVLHEDGGNCPHCKKPLVYRGESITAMLQRRGQAWEADHFFANMSANFEHTWVICTDCHNLLTPWRPGPTMPRIGAATRKFEGYHEGAKEVLRRMKRGEAEAEAQANTPLFAVTGNILPLVPRSGEPRPA